MYETGPLPAVGSGAEVPNRALTANPAPQRLVVARGVFAAPNVQATDDLYARVVRGTVHRERFKLRLEQGASVSADTYFGLFPASYFQRWTTADQVQLTLSVEADGPAQMLLCASDSRGNTRTIAGTAVDGTGAVTLSAPLDEFVDGGSLWWECTAHGGSVTIADLKWTVPSPVSIRPAALAICTFNRPDECADTLSVIARDERLLDGIDVLYVVDQGTDLLSGQALFNAAAAHLGPKLIYLRQPNLGGSGGFARAMHEVSTITDHANVILMDDDISCEPETVLRLNAFANLTPTPTIVGAQMLFLRNPRYLLAGAEAPDLTRLRPGRWAATAVHDVDVVKNRQNRRADAIYTGWWTCLIPAEIIAAVGLPFPMFIKWDDIEYSLRAAAAGYPTVTLPNAAVWHAEFHWKDVDDWTHYFQIRNALITAALRDHLDISAASRALAREITECLVSMRYGLAYTVVRAIEDFLKGPSILSDGGAEAVARIRAERSAFPDTVVHPANTTSALTNTLPTISTAKHPPRRDRINLVLAKRMIYQWLGRTVPGPVMIPAADNVWWHVSLFAHAVVTDASQTGVRVRRRDRSTLIRLTRRAGKTLRHFRAHARSAQHHYQRASPQICSQETWTRLFDGR